MDELSRIMFRMGYLTDSPLKKEEIKGYIEEAEYYMLTSGIPLELLSSPSAYAVKSVWADKRDKHDNLINKIPYLHLIAIENKWTPAKRTLIKFMVEKPYMFPAECSQKRPQAFSVTFWDRDRLFLL